MNLRTSEMAAFLLLLESQGMSREQIQDAILTVAKLKLTRSRDGGSPFTVETDQTQEFTSSHSTVREEAEREAVRADNARAKTASNLMRKLESPFSRAQLVRLNDSKRDQDKTYIKSGHFPMYTSLSGIDRKFSEALLKDLQRVNIGDLLLGKTHRGQYLLLRTISTPAMKDSVSVVIEDPKGRVDLLSIYNYPLGKIRTGSELDGIFPQGTIIAVLEPTYETPYEMPLNLAGGHVRVDSPTDFFFSRVTTSLGNHFFKLKQYRAAVAKYSEGIEQLSDATTWTCKVGVLYLNRAAAHLQIGNYNAALHDSSKFLKMFDDVADWGEESAVSLRAKALFRVAKSLDGLRLYSKAKEAYLAVLAHNPMRSEVFTAIARLERRMDEARNGTHDFFEMFKTGLANPEAPLDVSDYLGPICVNDIIERGGGRGIVATRDITAGEVLLVEKALAIGYKRKAGEPVITSLNLTTSGINQMGNHVALVGNLVERILDNPDLGDLVDALYGGENFPPTATFPFDNRYRKEAEIPSRPPSAKSIDIERIEQICTINAFSPQPDELLDPKNQQEAPVSSEVASLYPLTSIFNHQCAPSAVFSTYADIIVVRARKPIKTGEEIYISYLLYDLPYETRQKKLSTRFPCQCELCVEDEADGLQNRKERLQLLEQRSSMSEALITNSPLSAQIVESWFSSLEATYSKSRSSLRSELLGPSTVLAALERKRALNMQEHLRYVVIALEAVGVRLTHSLGKKGKGGKNFVPKVAIIEGSLAYPQRAVYIILMSVETLRLCGEMEEASAWAQAAFDVEDIASGGGKPLFFTRYQKAFAQVGKGLESFMRRQQ